MRACALLTGCMGESLHVRIHVTNLARGACVRDELRVFVSCIHTYVCVFVCLCVCVFVCVCLCLYVFD